MASSDYRAKLEQSQKDEWPTCSECVFCYIEKLQTKTNSNRTYFFCCVEPDLKELEPYRAVYLPGCEKSIPGEPEIEHIDTYKNKYRCTEIGA